MKKYYYLFIIICLLFISRCAKKEVDLSTISFENQSFEYDGLEHVLEIEGTLPDGVSVSYTKNSLVDVGVIEVTATFTCNSKYKEIQPMTATLEITPREVEIVVQNSSSIYGDEISTDGYIITKGSIIEKDLEELNIHEVIDSSISNESNVGVYCDVITLEYNSNPNYSITYIKGTYTIEKALIDLSSVEFIDKTVSYDGANHQIEINNLNELVSVKYYYKEVEFTGCSEIGSYLIEAVFTLNNPNYELSINSMKATLTIEKGHLDESLFEFADQTFSYDGLEHSILLKDELSDDYTVTYTNNTQVAAGNYTAIVTITHPNYNNEVVLEASLNIVKDGKFHDVILNKDGEINTFVYRNGDLIDQSKLNLFKLGYKWTLDYDLSIPVTSDLNITCTYEIINFTIDYIIGELDNNPNNPTEYNVLSEDILLEDISKKGYSFIGWYLDKDCTEEISIIKKGSAFDLTLYPKFEPLKFNINYYIGKNIGYTQEVLYDQEVELLNEFVYMDTYQVLEWNDGNNKIDFGYKFIYQELADLNIYSTLASIGEKETFEIIDGGAIITSTELQLEKSVVCSFALLNGVLYPVTGIGESAFRDCDYITSMILPETIKTIGESAFYNCINLVEINIPNDVEEISFSTFRNCKSLVNLTLPTNLKYIRNYAFSGCESLTKLSIPDSVINIGMNILNGANSLVELKVPFIGYELNDQSNSYLSYFFGGYSYKDNGSEIPSSLEVLTVSQDTSIKEYTFYYCTKIKTINYLNDINNVFPYTFYRCYNLLEVSGLDSVEVIGTHAFYQCRAFITNLFSNKLTTVGDYSFYECDSIINLVIPSSISEVGVSAFESCENLEEVYIESGLTEIKESTFKDCVKLKSVTMEDSIETIGKKAFRGCVRLTEINLSTNLNILGDYAFYNCTSLEAITIPQGVSTINASTFESCQRLETITIPKSVTYVSSFAFSGCSSLISVYYQGLLSDWELINFYNSSSNPTQYAKELYVLDENDSYYKVELS